MNCKSQNFENSRSSSVGHIAKCRHFPAFMSTIFCESLSRIVTSAFGIVQFFCCIGVLTRQLYILTFFFTEVRWCS